MYGKKDRQSVTNYTWVLTNIWAFAKHTNNNIVIPAQWQRAICPSKRGSTWDMLIDQHSANFVGLSVNSDPKATFWVGAQLWTPSADRLSWPSLEIQALPPLLKTNRQFFPSIFFSREAWISGYLLTSFKAIFWPAIVSGLNSQQLWMVHMKIQFHYIIIDFWLRVPDCTALRSLYSTEAIVLYPKAKGQSTISFYFNTYWRQPAWTCGLPLYNRRCSSYGGQQAATGSFSIKVSTIQNIGMALFQNT